MNITKKIISKEISDLTNFNLKQSSDFTNKFLKLLKKGLIPTTLRSINLELFKSSYT